MRDPLRPATGVIIALHLLILAVLLTSLPLVVAESHDRNPLIRIGAVRDTIIHNPTRRISSQSTFDLSFDLEGLRIRLALEPNHDLIPHDAVVQYLNADGSVDRTEPLSNNEHKVFKGRAKVQKIDGTWAEVGWARVMVTRDGQYPQLEGAFTVYGNTHHVMSSSEYTRTKHELDPDVEQAEEDHTVVFRDSDIADEVQHTELRRKRGLIGRSDSSRVGCSAEKLHFNNRHDHSVSEPDVLRRDKSFWGASSFSQLFARQLDTSPGAGNSAGANLVDTIGKTAGCPTTRKVALVGIASDCTYTSSFPTDQQLRRNVIRNMNSASNLFEATFSISLALRNLTVLPRDCPGQTQSTTPWNVECSPSTDIQDRLNLFSTWRGKQQDKNSHWTLLTMCRTNTAVGLAWLGQMCVQGSQVANVPGGGQESVAGANVVAKTTTEWQVIAHETGHTFGAVHDCTAETCADGRTVAAQQCCPLSRDTCDAGEQFIMNPATASGITQFSPCTVGNVCSAISSNVKSGCLSDNLGVKTITGKQCGNGIVEEGEDCDCGGETGCGDNQCCDPTTCKFRDSAVCDDANEDCCNNCQLASSTTVCRPSTGDCDPVETCTGSDSTCPRDDTLPDGESCGVEAGLQCASGQCTSRDLQCKTVMGSYTQGNDTYACDSLTCTLSCASPEFGTGVCYGLQQNFLDGTDCGGGGHCDNGQCVGNTFAGEVGSWIDDHKTLIIAVGSAVGGLLLLSILGCIYRCCRRRKNRPPKRRRGGVPSGLRAGAQRVPSSVSQQYPYPGPAPMQGQNSYQVSSTTQLWGQRGVGYDDHHQQQMRQQQNWQGAGFGAGYRNAPPPPPVAFPSQSVRYA